MARLKNLFNPIFLVWIVVIIILIPILRPGFFSFHDETHIVDVYEMIRSIELGGFPPRFVPDFNFNLGHPYFNFYYHLPFYITTVFHYLGFSMTDGYKYMLGISVIVAASGFYFFLRNHVGKTAAVFGTLVYVLSPYFAVDLYVRGSPGEMYIFALFPWAGFLLARFLKNSNASNLGLSAIPVFLIGISHNVLLPFIYPLLFLYGIVNLIILKTKFKNSLKIFLPFILGVLLASYYLLPAFVEVQFISSYEQFNIADHFPFIKQLIIPHWGYGPSIWGFLDDVSFGIGTVNLVLLAISFIFFKWAKREARILLIFFWIIFSLAVVLMNSRTLFFWESIRFLRLVQFPWRMLLLTTISTAFIAALTIEVFSEKFKKYSLGFLFVIFIALIGLNIWHYHPSESKQVTDEKYLETYFANRTLQGERERLSLEYLNFTEDFIPPTIWQKQRPKDLMEKVYFASDSGSIDYAENALGYQVNYETDQDNMVIISKAFFPGWTAGDLQVEPYSDFGIIAVPVASGSGSFSLKFSNTPIRNIANSISGIATGLILVLLIYGRFRKNR